MPPLKNADSAAKGSAASAAAPTAPAGKLSPAAAAAAAKPAAAGPAGGPAKAKRPSNLLAHLYGKLYDRFKGDPGKLTLFTMVMLCVSEVPIWVFTLLDVLKLKSLWKYRLHYDQSETSHLGARVYPPNDLIWKTMKGAELNFFGAYLIPGTLAISLANKLGIYVYDTECDEKEGKSKGVTWKRIAFEVLSISVIADFLFYALHRMMHTKRFYLPFHKKHHEFKYSIAFAHHWMEYKEALIFMFPQALPPIILWALTGQKSHVMSMWIAFLFTQLNAIVGHAGWRIPGWPRWLPFLQPSYHDWQ